jgi:hypothetical protein
MEPHPKLIYYSCANQTKIRYGWTPRGIVAQSKSTLKILKMNATSYCEMILNIENVRITEVYDEEHYVGFSGTSISTEIACRRCG